MSSKEALVPLRCRRTIAPQNRRFTIITLVALSALSITGCGDRHSGPNRTAVIETELGTIKVELLEDEAPKTTENFRMLAERDYYNGTIFHRVISNFMVQGGDPKGNGTGGETASGAPLPNEINRSSPLYQGGSYQRGLVAMANAGSPESGRSQFFIMHQTYPLKPNYTIFGRVIEGMDVVDKIATAPTTMGADGAKSRPLNPVKVQKVTIQ
jgi:cyclophilin family peptidyl-prolyl cis-trans isomerase